MVPRHNMLSVLFFFFQAEDGIRDLTVTGVQTCALPICLRPQVMIDVSHANSSKQHRRQIDVAADVAQQIAGGDARITGLMVESHLQEGDRKSTRLNSSHSQISYAVFCLKKKKPKHPRIDR